MNQIKVAHYQISDEATDTNAMIDVQVYSGEVTVGLVRYAVLWVFDGDDVRYLRKRPIPDDVALSTGTSQPVSQTGN